MPGGPAASGGGIGGTKKSKLAGVALTAFSAFGGILFGYDTGVINGVKEMKDWLRTFGHPDPNAPSGYTISSADESLVVSILSAGTFFGALLGAPMADYVGRKWGIILACLVFSVGVAMQTAATAIPLFVRIFRRSSPKWIRGAIVSMYQWAITIGLLIAAIVNNFTQYRDDHSSYRIPIAIQFVWAAILAGGMLFLPESPRWLVKRGRDNDAAVSLSRVTGHKRADPEVDAELEEIRANLQAELALGESSYLDCFKRSKNRIALRTLTGIFIQAWQQLTGINFIFYYGTTFFKNSGVSDPFLISIATNIVNVFMTLPGMWGVERFGRRRLLLVGALGMCICEYIIAIVGVTVSVQNLAGQKVLIAFVCIYIAFFAATWGPIAWVITGEIFPLQVRAKAISTLAPYLVNKQPGSAGLEAKVFFIWGSTCLCCIIFTYFCVPETKGLSLEQIDLMYQNTLPVNSLKYRRQLMSEGTSAVPDHDAKTEARGDDKA
ncbi:hypothetical protein C0992_012510 [Termitomyces sp. T32_za158]|nr:hypothetical protein C0992_012510 [Termitomyces sp. T32_za158]